MVLLMSHLDLFNKIKFCTQRVVGIWSGVCLMCGLFINKFLIVGTKFGANVFELKVSEFLDNG